VEKELMNIASSVDAKGFIHYQLEALGTAHAIFCAEKALAGEVIISFADTLFDSDLTIDNQEAIIWTKSVNNPENYGIAVTDDRNIIIRFVEKPKSFISNNAIIGIYYFKQGEKLRADIELLIKNNNKKAGEFQLTDSLDNLMKRGMRFSSKNVNEWLDCGNKTEFLKSNRYFLKKEVQSPDLSNFNDCNFIEPFFIGNNVSAKSCTIGPDVTIESDCLLENSTVSNSIIRNGTSLVNCNVRNSIVGKVCRLVGFNGEGNIGDYAEFNNL
jgi:glucose-1-phosphate thymidylyltransferase